MPGPVFAAPYHLHPKGYEAGTDGYGRGDNPTRRLLESALGELEGGDVLAFASGQAAITAALMAVLRPGDTLMLPSDGYYNVRVFGATFLTELNIRLVEVPTAGPYPGFDGVRMVLLESPANPSLDVVDIAAVASAARAAGAVVAVDNTAATPLGQRPLDLGADLSVVSATKAISGHSDLLMGYTATRSAGRGHPQPVRLLARTPLAVHARSPPAPADRQCRGARSGPGRPSTGTRSAVARIGHGPGVRGGSAADAALAGDRRLRTADGGPRRPVPGRLGPHQCGDELRRLAHLGRPPGTVGRPDRARLRPPVVRHRGRRRPGRRRAAGSGHPDRLNVFHSVSLMLRAASRHDRFR
jgi:hypothetical protein